MAFHIGKWKGWELPKQTNLIAKYNYCIQVITWLLLVVVSGWKMRLFAYTHESLRIFRSAAHVWKGYLIV